MALITISAWLGVAVMIRIDFFQLKAALFPPV
jgi:hypothetical protein